MSIGFDGVGFALDCAPIIITHTFKQGNVEVVCACFTWMAIHWELLMVLLFLGINIVICPFAKFDFN